MMGEPDPSWPRDAARAVGHEIAAYARTVGQIVRSPKRFAVEWSAGRLQALNPLAFLLNALAVLGPWRALWARVLDPNAPTTPLWLELAKPAYPVVSNLLLTSLAHGLMRLLGGKRPLRSSVALALYVSGGPLAILNFVFAPIALYGFLHRFDESVTPFSFPAQLTVLVCFFGYLIVMEAALHAISRWRVAAALLTAWATWSATSAWLVVHHPDVVRSFFE